MVAAGALYTTHLLQKATNDDAKTFVRDVVLNQRYRPLYKHVGAFVRQPNTNAPSYCGMQTSAEFSESEKSDIFEVAERHAKVFEGVPIEHAAVWLGNIAEQV